MGDTITLRDFEQIFREYFVRLYCFAYDFVEDAELARDIVSEVFASVWQRRQQMERDSVVGYLFISVRNQCLNHIKMQRRTDDYADFVRAVTDEEDVAQWITLEERIAELAKAMDSLSPRTRYVLEECYYNQLSYREVAEELGISIDGVKKHIVKAFAVLRAHFKIKK
jgi:RNA polymerase sigma-70 factor (ECF subfamily)